jgi:tetratricopeptide (TPR) repeat protein
VSLVLLQCAAGCTTLPAPAPGHGALPPAVRPEALSMLGRPLYRRALPPEREATLQSQLDSALSVFEANPGDADALLWVGRRLAYLGHYREAIAAFTRGIALHPSDARFYHHRGHRYITCRQFDLAIADLQLAATLVDGQTDRIEPDGQPNTAGVPLSTLHGNIFYHLALAYYLRQEHAEALPHWRRARALARNDDTMAAVSNWLYLTHRRLGQLEKAEELLLSMRPNQQIIENQAYFDLLQLYRGELTPALILEKADATGQLATYGYGLASWYAFSGEPTKAEAMLRQIVDGPDWAAFGYIAAEADLERAARPR